MVDRHGKGLFSVIINEELLCFWVLSICCVFRFYSLYDDFIVIFFVETLENKGMK